MLQKMSNIEDICFEMDTKRLLIHLSRVYVSELCFDEHSDE